jgi:hypothetical protein
MLPVMSGPGRFHNVGYAMRHLSDLIDLVFN